MILRMLYKANSKNHGGKRKGAGRHSLSHGEQSKRIGIRVSPETYEWLKNQETPISEFIRQLILTHIDSSIISKKEYKMDNQSVTNLAKLYEMISKIEALKSEREGMLQTNRQREIAGHSAAYDENDFADQSEGFVVIGKMINHMFNLGDEATAVDVLRN